MLLVAACASLAVASLPSHSFGGCGRDGTGIIDPRVYVYFERNIDTLWVPAPQSPFEAEWDGLLEESESGLEDLIDQTKIIDIQIGKMSAAVISLFLGGGEYREKMQVLPIGSSKYQYKKFLLRISPRFYLFLNELSWKVSPVFVQKRFYYLCMNIFCCGKKEATQIK